MKVMRFLAILICLSFIFSPVAFSLEDEAERFYTARRAFGDGFYEASQFLFERFIKDFPKSKRNTEAQLFIAKCQFFKGQYKEALMNFTELSRERGARRWRDEIYYWLAEVNLKGKNFKATYDYAQKILKDYPDSSFKWWAYYLAGMSALELSYPNPDKYFNEAIEGSPDITLIHNIYTRLADFYFREKDYTKLIKLSEKYVAVFPKGNLAAKMYFYMGESYSVKADFKKAIHNYKKALNTTRDANLKDLVYRGMVFLFIREDKFDDAKSYIEKIQSEELKLFCEGVYSFSKEDYLTALEKFDSFLERFPKSSFIVTVYLDRAEVLYEMGRLNDALGVYTYIIDEFKGRVDNDTMDKAHYGLAWCYLKKGEFKKAIAEFKETLKYTENPTVKVSSQIQIAEATQEAGDNELALEIYNEILEDYPNTIYADYIQLQIGLIFLKNEQLESALMAFDNLKRNFPSSRLIPEAQYYLAVGYFSSQNYLEAKSLLEDFLKLYPDSDLFDDAKYLYGKCFFNEKNYDRALGIFRQIASESKDNRVKELVYIDMGNAYLNLSKTEEARKVWEDFLKQFPKSQYGRSVALYLGGIYESNKNYTEAQKYYALAAEYGEDSSGEGEAYISLGHLYWRKGDLDIAKDYFQKAADIDTPIALKAKLYLAKLYAQENDIAEALKVYDELIEANLQISKAAMLEKAYLLKEVNNYDDAIIALRQAIDTGMDSAKARFYLALCLEKVSEYEAAIDEYFKVIYGFTPADSQDENWNTKSYFRIANIYEKEGKVGAAKDIYKKIIELDVNESRIAREKLESLNKN